MFESAVPLPSLAVGTVPEDKLPAVKFVSALPFAAGSVAGNLASGIVPAVSLAADISVPSLAFVTLASRIVAVIISLSPIFSDSTASSFIFAVVTALSRMSFVLTLPFCIAKLHL